MFAKPSTFCSRYNNNIMDFFFTRDAYICMVYRYNNTQLDDLEFGLCLCWEAVVVRMPVVFIKYYLYFGLILITYTLKHPLPQKKNKKYDEIRFVCFPINSPMCSSTAYIYIYSGKDDTHSLFSYIIWYRRKRLFPPRQLTYSCGILSAFDVYSLPSCYVPAIVKLL